MLLKIPEMSVYQFTAYAKDVSDGISAVNHYVNEGHHAFTMWQVEPDVPGLTNVKVLVSEYYYQNFRNFLHYYELDFYEPVYRQFIVRI